MMKNIKKVLKSLLPCLLISLFVCVFFGCTNKKKEDLPQTLISQNQPSLTLNYTNLKMDRGTKTTLQATLHNLEGEVIWYSYDDTIVSVDAVSGEMTALKSGSTTVVAYVGDISASCEVIVAERIVEANDYALTLSNTELFLNANSDSHTAVLTALLAYNQSPITGDIAWVSSNTENVSVTVDETDNTKATVTALKNGATAIITATATVNGVTVSGSCEVTADVFSVIIPKYNNVALYPGESKALEYELYIDGVLSDEKKSDVQFESVNPDIATVDGMGVLTAIRKGETYILIRYANRTTNIKVSVGERVYISTAEQFMAINGTDERVIFTLQNDIDLSTYLAAHTQINAEYLIENFNATLDGQGYCVSGWQRFATADDTGFKGLFACLGEEASISALHIQARIDCNNPSPLLFGEMNGKISDCLFKISGDIAVDDFGCALFNMCNGSVENSIFVIEPMNEWRGDAFIVSNSGYGSFVSISVISPTLTYGAYINKNGDIVNQSFDQCYYYTAEKAFEDKDGYVLGGTGRGDKYTFENVNYDETHYYTQNGKIYAKNAKGTQPTVYPQTSPYVYLAVSVGQKTLVQLPQTELSIAVIILDENNRDVTKETYKDGYFAPQYEGIYKIFHNVSENGVVASAMSFVEVKNELPKINATAVVLSLEKEKTFALSVVGTKASDFRYYTENDTIVSVSETGVLSATAVGETTVRVVHKTKGNVYTVNVSVTSAYKTVSDALGLREALATATEKDIVVMTNNISLTTADLQSAEKITGKPYKFFVDSFKGTLDGQGYTLSLDYEGDGNDVLSGVIYTIETTATVKNLHYQLVANCIPTTLATPSIFARVCNGTIDNCYLQAELRKTQKTSYVEAFVNSISGTTARCYNTVFDIKTWVNDEYTENGTTFNTGSSQAHVYNSVLIRNGLSTAFYNSGTLPMTENTHYRTVYDFVYALNGNRFSTHKISTPLTDGGIVYAGWDSVWKIDKNGIYLCGNKITDVTFERYNVPFDMPLSISGGTLSWNISGSADIYVNGSLVNTTTEKSFALSDYVFGKYGEITTTYKIRVKTTTQSGVVAFSVIGLDKETFIPTLESITSREQCAYTYYYLKENIDVTEYSSDKTYIGMKCALSLVYADLDGRGRMISWTHTQSSGAYGGLISTLSGATWKNLVVQANITLQSGTKAVGLFAYSINDGARIENCAFRMDVTSYSALDVPFAKAVSGNATIENCIIELNDLNEADDKKVIVAGEGSHVSTCKNVVVIGTDTGVDLFDATKRGVMTISCYEYANYADFIAGINGVYLRSTSNGLQAEIATNKAYESWGNVWTITAKEVRLLNKVVATTHMLGDTIVDDDDILQCTK